MLIQLGDNNKCFQHIIIALIITYSFFINQYQMGRKEKRIMLATKIKMKTGCGASNNLLEIDSIYLTGVDVIPSYYKKEDVYDEIKNNNVKIKVDIWPYPELQAVLSANGEKYVRSTPNQYGFDNLLSLPRE